MAEGTRPDPVHPELRNMVRRLAESACDLRWTGKHPLRNANNVAKPELFWEWFGIGLGDLRQWHAFDPARRAPDRLVKVGKALIEVLRAQVPALLSADAEVFTGADDVALTRGKALELVHQLWAATKTDCEMLAEALDLAVSKHKRFTEGERPAPTRLPPELVATLPNDATVLEIAGDVAPISVEGRRNLFLRPADWNNVCAGGYCRRPILDRKILPDALAFLEKAPDAAAVFQLPVFWIGGRSGDGKSILLMQLAHYLCQNEGCPPLVRFADPDSFVAWLGRHAAAPALAGPNLKLVAVVDDLHKISNWSEAGLIFTQAATSRCGIAVVTCGPTTPEREYFKDEMQHAIAFTSSDASKLVDEDWLALADHLGVTLVASDPDRPATLVERIFLSLPGRTAQTIRGFAESLADRVEAGGDRKNLLEQLTLMTMLDLELPATYVGEEAAAWLEQLSSDTQLHIAPSAAGFRFGHPQIAAPVYDALTGRSRPGERLEHRIADTLLQVLPGYQSVIPMVRVLRQVQGHLAKSNSNDSNVVLRRILETTNRQNIHQATAIAIMGGSERRKEPLGEDIKKLARTIRDHRQSDLPTKALVLRGLAVAPNADPQDFNHAVRALKDPQLAPLLGRFVWRLKSNDLNRYLMHGWVKSIVLDWVRKYRDDKHAQDVLAHYIANHSDDHDVYAAFCDFIADVDPRKLTSSFMVNCAARMESETGDLIRDWLASCEQPSGAVSVLAALLAKQGSPWKPEAISFLEGLDKSGSDFVIALGTLLTFIGHDIGIQLEIEALAGRMIDQPKSHGFFTALADSDPLYDFGDILDRRISYLKGLEPTPDNRRELYSPIANVWRRIGGDYPAHASVILEMMALLAGEGAAGLKPVMNTARDALVRVLGSGAHSQHYLEAACRYVDEPVDALLEGMVAGSLLNDEARLVSHDERFAKVINSRRARLQEIAWKNARKAEGTVPEAQEKCSLALIRTMRAEQMPALRAAFADEWRNLSGRGRKTLVAWLANELSRDDALEVLLSDATGNERLTRMKGRIAANNQLILYDAYAQLAPLPARRLMNLLKDGIADFKSSSAAAWYALQHRDRWPQGAEKHIWAGVLTSALHGHTIAPDGFWRDFEAWQSVVKDPECRRIAEKGGRRA